MGTNGKYLTKVIMSIYKLDFKAQCFFAALLDPSTKTIKIL